jgi:pectate disaccharide-lyase
VYGCRLLLLYFLLLTSASAQTGVNEYYVSPLGSDVHNGSKRSPWRTLQHAAENLQLGSAGTVVHVAPGTYTDVHYCSRGLVNGATMMCVEKSGTATQPIIVQSDQRWQAKLRCTRSVGMFFLLGSYIQIVGFDMSCPNEGSFAGATYGNNSHNQFLNNYLHDFDVTSCSSVGVLNGNVTAKPGWTNIGHHVASGNVIHHAGAAGGAGHCNQEHGLYFGDPYDVLTNNVISGVIGVGIHSYGGGICHQVISNNTIFDNSQGGILIENVATLGGDYWDECGNGGVSDYNTVTNNIIANNGIGHTYDGEFGGIDGRGRAGGGHNLFSHNLIYGNRPQQASLVRPDESLKQATGNDLSVFQDYKPDHNWAPASDYDYRNYALKVGSPAIDSGTATCASDEPECPPRSSITGADRPIGKTFDVGAFEFVPQRGTVERDRSVRIGAKCRGAMCTHYLAISLSFKSRSGRVD